VSLCSFGPGGLLRELTLASTPPSERCCKQGSARWSYDLPVIFEAFKIIFKLDAKSKKASKISVDDFATPAEDPPPPTRFARTRSESREIRSTFAETRPRQRTGQRYLRRPARIVKEG
jgi:hypothetical protein